MAGGDYTQERNAAASEAVAIGQQMQQLRGLEAQLMRGIASSQDSVLISQLMEDLDETRKNIKSLKAEAKKPPVTEAVAPVPTTGSQDPGPPPPATAPVPEGEVR